MDLPIKMIGSSHHVMPLFLGNEPFQGVTGSISVCHYISMMKFEYVAHSFVMQKAIWLRRFLSRLNIIGYLHDAIVIY